MIESLFSQGSNLSLNLIVRDGGAVRSRYSFNTHRFIVSVQGGKQVGGQFARKTERARRAGEDGT
ncbi:MAG: hypothetical protein JXA30_14420, partial [Deltaproteobacteria bacterium]|nr:hypothetical protein [Deltaproteobacteria bacterium]